MHPYLNEIVAAFADGQQFEGIAHFPAIGNIIRADAGNALPMNFLIGDTGMEGDGGENGKLVSGIKSLHVCRGIRLGKAKLLRLGQNI